MFWLGALTGAGFAAYRVWQQRQLAPMDSPQWPPLPVDAPGTTTVAPVAQGADQPADPAASWVEPVDGTCPDGYPVKANNNSGIFHVPGGRFYDRTVAERCYANEDDAVADGYRPAKA
jgi:hypothetical protein